MGQSFAPTAPSRITARQQEKHEDQILRNITKKRKIDADIVKQKSKHEEWQEQEKRLDQKRVTKLADLENAKQKARGLTWAKLRMKQAFFRKVYDIKDATKGRFTAWRRAKVRNKLFENVLQSEAIRKGIVHSSLQLVLVPPKDGDDEDNLQKYGVEFTNTDRGRKAQEALKEALKGQKDIHQANREGFGMTGVLGEVGPRLVSKFSWMPFAQTRPEGLKQLLRGFKKDPYVSRVSFRVQMSQEIQDAIDRGDQAALAKFNIFDQAELKRHEELNYALQKHSEDLGAILKDEEAMNNALEDYEESRKASSDEQQSKSAKTKPLTDKETSNRARENWKKIAEKARKKSQAQSTWSVLTKTLQEGGIKLNVFHQKLGPGTTVTMKRRTDGSTYTLRADPIVLADGNILTYERKRDLFVPVIKPHPGEDVLKQQRGDGPAELDFRNKDVSHYTRMALYSEFAHMFERARAAATSEEEITGIDEQMEPLKKAMQADEQSAPLLSLTFEKMKEHYDAGGTAVDEKLVASLASGILKPSKAKEEEQDSSSGAEKKQQVDLAASLGKQKTIAGTISDEAFALLFPYGRVGSARTTYDTVGALSTMTSLLGAAIG